MAERTHELQSVVVNNLHLWECRKCGAQFLPNDPGKRFGDCPVKREGAAGA